MLLDPLSPLLELGEVDHLGLVGVDQPAHLAIQRLELAADAFSFPLLSVVHRRVVSALLVAGFQQSRRGRGAPKVKDTLSERILTEAEAHRLMNAPSSPGDRALISVLYAGALRREEAVCLKWRDLKEREDLGPGVGQATVFGKGSKTGVALLPASVFSQVRALRKVTGRAADGTSTERHTGEDEPVFRSRKRRNGCGGHLEVSQVNRIVDRAAKDAGIGRSVSPHWLRHAHASYAHARKDRPSAHPRHLEALLDRHHGPPPAREAERRLGAAPGPLKRPSPARTVRHRASPVTLCCL